MQLKIINFIFKYIGSAQNFLFLGGYKMCST